MAIPVIGDKPTTARVLIIRGDDWTPELVWKVADEPVILTDYSMELRGKDGDGNLVLDYSTVNGKIILNGTPGLIRFKVVKAETELIPVDEGTFDFSVTDSLGITKTKFRGAFSVENQL